jgi:hypothetical protein
MAHLSMASNSFTVRDSFARCDWIDTPHAYVPESHVSHHVTCHVMRHVTRHVTIHVMQIRDLLQHPTNFHQKVLAENPLYMPKYNAIQAGQWIDLPGNSTSPRPRDRNQPGTGISPYRGIPMTEGPDSAHTGGSPRPRDRNQPIQGAPQGEPPVWAESGPSVVGIPLYGLIPVPG